MYESDVRITYANTEIWSASGSIKVDKENVYHETTADEDEFYYELPIITSSNK